MDLIALLFILFLVVINLYALGKGCKSLPLRNCKGVKLVAPNLSFEASGTIGKIITFAKVRGIKYARSWFKPFNPQTAEQVNMRTALALAVAFWQVSLAQAQKDAYGVGASGTKDTGFSLYMGRALDAYISQIGVATLPTALTSVTGNYPSDVFLWSSI